MKTNILLPKYPKVIKKGENKAIFEIENCYPGYGLTLGNAFRRVLLSSLQGAAVTSVKIKGVSHEFSTIPNVMEDAIQIILNLKQIRFALSATEKISLSLKAKGEKKVTASDIKLTSDVKILNKDAHIATLTDKKAEIEMDIEVSPGRGYEQAVQRSKEKLAIGYIAIDAIFSPVKNVNSEVENMRVGDKTDFNRLKIEIETDGTISPEEAFQQSAQTLVKHFNLFTGETKTKKEKPAIKAKPKAGAKVKVKVKTKKIAKK